MKEILRILDAYAGVEHRASPGRAAFATVVWVEGSAYRRPGARMLITDDGRWEGGISGGCLEGDALRQARAVMRSGQPVVVRYDTRTEQGAGSLGVGLGCEGIIDVFIEPIDPTAPNNPIAQLRAFAAHRDWRVLATVLATTLPTDPAGGNVVGGDAITGNGENDPAGRPAMPGTRYVLTDATADAVPTPLRSAMQAVGQTGRPERSTFALPGGLAEVFIERLDPGIDLVLFGAGADTLPVIRLAQELGWRVTVTEDCVAHLAPSRFPAATCVLYADRHAVLANISVGPRTAAVLLSHNYAYDKAVLQALLTTDAPYIGMLGPRKRFERMLTELAETNPALAQTAASRVYAPIGLDIGAEAPDEIALAIIAEIRAHFAERPAGFLRDRSGPIHARPGPAPAAPENNVVDHRGRTMPAASARQITTFEPSVGTVTARQTTTFG